MKFEERSEEEYEEKDIEYSENDDDDDDDESVDLDVGYVTSDDDDDNDDNDDDNESDDSTPNDTYDFDNTDLLSYFGNELHDRLILGEDAENMDFLNEEIYMTSSRSTEKKKKKEKKKGEEEENQTVKRRQEEVASTKERPSYPFSVLPVSYSDNADTIDYLGFSSQLMDVKNQSLDLDELLK